MDQQNGKGEGSLEHPSADQDSGLCPVESPRADIDLAAISASVVAWPIARSPLAEGGFSFQVKHVNEAGDCGCQRRSALTSNVLQSVLMQICATYACEKPGHTYVHCGFVVKVDGSMKILAGTVND